MGVQLMRALVCAPQIAKVDPVADEFPLAGWRFPSTESGSFGKHWSSAKDGVSPIDQNPPR
jgi:hypothetical protein